MKNCFMTRALAVLLSLSLLLPLLAGTGRAAQDDSLSAQLAAFMAKYGLNESNFSCSYFNTVTGESCSFNENRLMTAASLYKLPLNMYYYEQEAAGNISPNARYGGYPLSQCHQQSLQFSNNELSQAMVRALGTTSRYKHLMLKYGGVPETEIGQAFFRSNCSSSRYMMGVLKYLYARSDFFSQAIGYLKAAHPGMYFKKYVSQYPIAQKYGWLNYNFNCAAIVYTDEPYLVVAYSDHVPSNLEALGRLNAFFCAYNTAHYGGRRLGEGSLYRDVQDEAWYFPAVREATELGVLTGVGDKNFAPDGALTLAQAVRLACCVHAKLTGGSAPGTDCQPWYQSSVDYALQNGILKTDDFAGSYDRACTRAEFAGLLCRAMPETALAPVSTLTALPDVAESAEWGVEIYALYRAGVLTGFDEAGSFRPDAAITRAEVAAVAVRALKASARTAKIYPASEKAAETETASASPTPAASPSASPSPAAELKDAPDTPDAGAPVPESVPA